MIYKIYEQGNGFPEIGDLVCDDDATVLRIEDTNGRIHTRQFCPNYILADLSYVGDVSDLTDVEYAAVSKCCITPIE